jgi:hypothetical protein
LLFPLGYLAFLRFIYFFVEKAKGSKRFKKLQKGFKEFSCTENAFFSGKRSPARNIGERTLKFGLYPLYIIAIHLAEFVFTAHSYSGNGDLRKGRRQNFPRFSPLDGGKFFFHQIWMVDRSDEGLYGGDCSAMFGSVVLKIFYFK